MANPRYNTQTANPRGKAAKTKKRVKRNMGGSMNPAMARQDMQSGYYPSDMGMAGGKMMKKGGKA